MTHENRGSSTSRPSGATFFSTSRVERVGAAPGADAATAGAGASEAGATAATARETVSRGAPSRSRAREVSATGLLSECRIERGGPAPVLREETGAGRCHRVRTRMVRAVAEDAAVMVEPRYDALTRCRPGLRTLIVTTARPA